MTEIKLNSQTIDNLANYLTELEGGLNAALLNISFNENEIKRLTGELEQAKARYLMTRSDESKKSIETIEKAIDDARKELLLDYAFLENREKRYSMIVLSEQEMSDIISDINSYMKPVQDKKEAIYQKIDELNDLVGDCACDYDLYFSELDRAISIVNQACRQGTDKKIIVNADIHGLKIRNKLRDVVSTSKEDTRSFS